MNAPLISCPKCGQVVPADAPSGLCPRCLVAGGFTAAERPASSSGNSDSKATLHIVIPEDAALPAGAPRQLGKYELLEEIARGGMGIVYKARHTGLDSIVAVKMIRSGVLATPIDVERFQREARAAAKLQHPNIVTIHDIGEQDGQHYFSMDYVPGANLAELARTRPFSAKQAAEITAGVAAAIHYAHQQGVLHRDVKPANVILTPEQQPRVLDFGLARVLKDDSQLTVSGTPMGSPCYMPPEQAAGKTRAIDERSDVYSLGALLYELITGRPPFQAASTLETLRLVMESDPVLPRLFSRTLPADLETICLKCLEKEPTKRYASAQELADELGRFLADKPIQARRITQTERFWRWCRRNPVVASLSTATAVLVLALAIGAPIAAFRIDRARQAEARQRLRAEQSLYTADMLLAHQALAEHNVGRVVELLERHRPEATAESPARLAGGRKSESKTDLRGWEWRYLWRQTTSDELLTLGHHSHSHSVKSVAFAPGGTMLASASAEEVILWNVATGRKVISLAQPNEVEAVALSRDGLLAAACADQTVRLWDTKRLQEPPVLFRHPGELRSLAFSPDGATLCTACEDGVRLWDVSSKRDPQPEKIAIEDAFRVAFSVDGKTLAVAQKSKNRIILWDWEKKSPAAALDVPSINGNFGGLTFSPDGRYLASAFYYDPVRIWDVKTRREVANLTNHTGWVGSMAFAANGRILATGSADQTIKLWDVATWRELDTLKGHLNEVWALDVSPDGNSLASGGKDGAVKLWSAKPKDRQRSSVELPAGVKLVALSTDGRHLLAAQTNAFSVWETATLQKTSDGSIPLPAWSSAALGAGGRRLAVGDSNGLVQLWDSRPIRSLRRREGVASCVNFLAFSADATKLAASFEDGRVAVWDASNGNVVTEFQGPPANRKNKIVFDTALTFSPDRRLLAAGHRFSSSVLLWDLERNLKVRTLSGHSDLVNGAAFAPDGNSVATVSMDGTMRLWRVSDPESVLTLGRHSFAYMSVAFSPDGLRLAANNAGTIRLWDLTTAQETPQEVAALPQGPWGFGAPLAFLPEGDTLVCAGFHQPAIHLWRAASFAEIDATQQTKLELNPNLLSKENK